MRILDSELALRNQDFEEMFEELIDKFRKPKKNGKENKCLNKECPAWRPCGCFQNLEEICKKAKFENGKRI